MGVRKGGEAVETGDERLGAGAREGEKRVRE